MTITCSFTCLKRSPNNLQIHRQICKFTHQDLRYFLTKYKVRIRLVLQSDRLQVTKTVIILSRFDSPRLHIKRNGIAAVNKENPSSSLVWIFFCLQTSVFAKDSKWHLQVWNSGAERSYSPRLHKKA